MCEPMLALDLRFTRCGKTWRLPPRNWLLDAANCEVGILDSGTHSVTDRCIEERDKRVQLVAIAAKIDETIEKTVGHRRKKLGDGFRLPAFAI